MKIKAAIGISILLLLLAAAASCVQTNDSSTRATLAVTNKVLKTDAAGKVTLAVTIKNTGRVNAELAEVKVTFYDAQKNVIDSATDSVMNLKPNETWDFTIPCTGDNCSKIASYDIETTAGSSSGG
jgi:uncharacterized membrane protein